MESTDPVSRAGPTITAKLRPGWEAAMREIEHQAEHWDTPDHGETGSLIAQALRAAVDIARAGGLHCEHRRASTPEARPRKQSSHG